MDKKFEWDNWESKEIRTCCKLCLNGCGMIVKRVNESITIEGDPEHPLSKGFLCAKGLSSFEIGDLPERILYPVKRKGNRGEGKWERISWEEAIEGISLKIKRIIEKYGPESVCVQSLPPKDVSIWYAFASALGTPNFFRHDHHVCFTPILIADILTFGNLILYPNLSYEDAEKTKTIVLWGINPPETNPAKWKIMEKAKKHGAKLIVVDPRPTRSAKEADLWLRVKPGTDLALAMGMLNFIIKGGMHDKEFIERWTYGFEKLLTRIEEFPLEKASHITGVDRDLIAEAATIIAKNKPSAIFTFMGLVMSGNSINALRSLGILLAVTGNVDIEGGNLIKIPPRTEKINIPEDLLKKQISSEKFPLLSGPSSLVSRILPSPNPYDVIEAMIKEKPYPVKALLTDCNPLTALEGARRTLEAIMRLELIVVFELFMTPTAEFADYVLPITWFYESNGIAEYSGMNFIAARRRVIKPKGEAKEEGEILIEIMRSLGVIGKLPFESYEEYLDYRLSPLKMSFREFSERSYVLNPVIEKKYEKGLLREDGRPGFNTPSGKVEIYSSILEKYGYEPIPVYREPGQIEKTEREILEDYPFVMITGVRTFAHYHGLGVQIPQFRKLDPDPVVEIAYEATQKLGLKEGDYVFIEVPGREDMIIRKVKPVEDLHPNVIALPGHWYLPEEKNQRKRIWEVHMNVLTELRDDCDPVIGGSSCRALLARIRKIVTTK
jgi:anaerobic selenocysteine-containing dehydrogenase